MSDGAWARQIPGGAEKQKGGDFFPLTFNQNHSLAAVVPELCWPRQQGAQSGQGVGEVKG